MKRFSIAKTNMDWSKANPKRKTSLISIFPLMASSAVFAILVVSCTLSSSLWCDAKNATTEAISGRKQSKDKTIGKSSNETSTQPSYDSSLAIYHELGVRPPHNSTKVAKIGFGIELPFARWSWKIHGKLLPLLHFFDRDRPDDVFVNLRVLWCKLLISLDPRSPAYEGRKVLPWQPAKLEGRDRDTGYSCNGGMENPYSNNHQLYATYRMLPHHPIKWAIRYLGLWKIFPRWMHANIELRVVYLQSALEKLFGSDQNLLENSPEDKNIDSKRICVIVLGGGYDPRGAKLFASGKRTNTSSNQGPRTNIQRVYELDLPKVVDSKRQLLLRAGFDVSDDSDIHKIGVHLERVDLNDDFGVERVLDKVRDELIAIASNTTTSTNDSVSYNQKIKWHVVLVSEALLLYLNPRKAERILEGVSKRFSGNSCKNNHSECPFKGATFVFADRLMRHSSTTDNIKAGASPRRAMSLPTSREGIEKETSDVRKWLMENGWELNELLLKPGATRHLGIATTTTAVLSNSQQSTSRSTTSTTNGADNTVAHDSKIQAE